MIYARGFRSFYIILLLGNFLLVIAAEITHRYLTNALPLKVRELPNIRGIGLKRLFLAGALIERLPSQLKI